MAQQTAIVVTHCAHTRNTQFSPLQSRESFHSVVIMLLPMILRWTQEGSSVKAESGRLADWATKHRPPDMSDSVRGRVVFSNIRISIQHQYSLLNYRFKRSLIYPCWATPILSNNNSIHDIKPVCGFLVRTTSDWQTRVLRHDMNEHLNTRSDGLRGQ